MTEGVIATFYAVLYQTVAREASKALCDRYSTNDLEIVDLLRRSLEDSAMTMDELTKVAKFYEADISLDAVWHERNNWFKRCSLLGDVPSIKTLREKLAEEEALKFMMPNIHMLCVIYVCLPVSTCEAERSFSMLRRIHTYLRNTQTQERLNHIGVLCAQRDIARTVELRASMNEFVNSTAQRRNTFGPAC